MMLKERRGRPRRPLGPPTARITARLRRLVDDVHEGSLLEASAHAGIPYATLREIHSGRATTPARSTLHRIARAYGLPVDWFTAPDDGTVPAAGWVGYLPGETGAGGVPARRVTIPVGAWPLIRVLVQLEQRLRDLPPHPDRPILGAATDPRECRRRLTAFILQPLLEARRVGNAEGETPLPPLPGSLELRGPSPEPWIDMLRDLGHFWERALGSLLPCRAGPGSGH